MSGSSPLPSPLSSLPAEVTEVVISHLPLPARLALRLVCRRMNSLVVRRTPALCPPDSAHFEWIKMEQVPGMLFFSTSPVHFSTAMHFVPLVEHAVETWGTRRGDEMVDCEATFSLTADNDYTLFESATVDNLDITKQQGGHLYDLERLLVGCRVAKVTLDHQMMYDTYSVRSFMRVVSCRTVNFLLNESDYYDKLEPFTDESLARALAEGGVEEVIFSGYDVGSRRDDEGLRNVKGMLSTFFTAGIKRVDMENTMSGMYLKRTHLDILIDDLTKLGVPLELRANLYMELPYLPDGIYRRQGDEEHRRTVRVEDDDDDFGGRGSRLVIEIRDKTV